MTLAAGRLRAPWLLPAALVVIAVGVLGAVVLISQRVGNEHLRPPAPAFTYPGREAPIVRFTVKSAADGTFVLAEDSLSGAPAPAPREVAIGPATQIEILGAAGPGDIKVKDWLSVIGIPNEVRNFSVHSLVLLPPAGPDEDGVVRSANGFAGSEAAANPDDRVILGGAVQSIGDGSVTIAGPAGPVTIDLTDRAPILRLVEGAPDDLQAGDRIAIHSGDDLDAPSAILVSPAVPR